MKTTRQNKIDWLLSNQSIWQGYPSATVTSEKIYMAMFHAGHFTKIPTGEEAEFTMRSAVSGLIRDARAQRRAGTESTIVIHRIAHHGGLFCAR